MTITLRVRAHDDDIHGLIKLEDGTLITGSKEGSLKKWDVEKKFFSEICEPNKHDYSKWITALSPLDDESWVCGTRDGRITVYSNAGKVTNSLSLSLQNRACKKRNQPRITTLARCIDTAASGRFMFGRPGEIGFMNKDGSEPLEVTRIESDDWFYALKHLDDERMLVARGTALEVWGPGEKDQQLCQKETLIPSYRGGGNQKPFISSFTPLIERPGHFALSLFDGSVRVYDIEKKKPLFYANEHKGRVWQVENINPQTFASSADDGLIKLWDTRQKKSTQTLKDTLGRVSVMLYMGNNTLISGACPNDLSKTTDRAQLIFWSLTK